MTLTLEVLATDQVSVDAAICAGESFSFDGQSLTQAGEYAATFQNQAGCDSTVTLTLEVLPTFQTSVDAVICTGESYAFNDQLLTQSGQYEATFQSTVGCDSTVNLSLTILPTNQTSMSASICAGDSYPFDGGLLTESGQYTAVLQNAAGCDSTVTLDLSVLPVDNQSVQATICAGETYLFNGEELGEAGEYTAVLQNADGCDSTVMLLLLVFQPDTSFVQDEGTLVANAEDADYQWLDCEGGLSPVDDGTEATFTPSVSGEYALQVIQQGCAATSDCVSVIVTNVEERNPAGKLTIFPNPGSRRVTVDLGGIRRNISVEVRTVAGRSIWSGVFANQSLLKLDVAGWPEGLYYLLFEIDGEKVERRFVKKG